MDIYLWINISCAKCEGQRGRGGGAVRPEGYTGTSKSAVIGRGVGRVKRDGKVKISRWLINFRSTVPVLRPPI